MMITQTQMEALASFFSSISISSFVAIQMPIVTHFPLIRYLASYHSL